MIGSKLLPLAPRSRIANSSVERELALGDAWLKLKIRPEQELVVGGWTPGEGNARDLGALAVGVYEDGKLRFGGKVGSGFTGALRKELLARLKPLAVDEPPFDPPPPKDYRGRWGGDLRESRGSARSS